MLHQKQVKSVLNKQKQRDSWFLVDYSINPYEGCSCNCLYCYIRGSKYSENMEVGLAVRINALRKLEKQLQARARKDAGNHFPNKTYQLELQTKVSRLCKKYKIRNSILST